MIGPDRKLDPKALGFPEDFWNYGDPYEAFPIDTARLKNVIRLAAEKAGWGKTLPEKARSRHRRTLRMVELRCDRSSMP